MSLLLQKFFQKSIIFTDFTKKLYCIIQNSLEYKKTTIVQRLSDKDEIRRLYHEKPILSCDFDFDTDCVKLKFLDGAKIAFNTVAGENEIADNNVSAVRTWLSSL